MNNYSDFDAYIAGLVSSNVTNFSFKKTKYEGPKQRQQYSKKANSYTSGTRKVIDERSDWRDEKLDEILFKHNAKCFEFCVSEYNHGKSCAIINYLHKGSDIRADESLKKYCEMRKTVLPYFTVEYEYKLIEENGKVTGFNMLNYIVYPHNNEACKVLTNLYGNPNQIELTEYKFVDFLYKIRHSDKTSPYYKKALENAGLIYNFSISKNISDIYPKRIISLRHRNFEWDTPCVDFDCMIVDQHENPTNIVEFKRKNNHVIDPAKFFNKAIADLGDGCSSPIPVVLCCYNSEEGNYRIADFYNSNKQNIPYDLKTYKEVEFFNMLKKGA